MIGMNWIVPPTPIKVVVWQEGGAGSVVSGSCQENGLLVWQPLGFIGHQSGSLDIIARPATSVHAMIVGRR